MQPEANMQVVSNTTSSMVADKAIWEERLRVLKDRIMFHIANIPDCEVTVEHLYYNGFHSS